MSTTLTTLFLPVSMPVSDEITEWPAGVLAQVPAAWRSSPFRQFIVKIASRCNLSCDYCYMYEMSDDSWRRQADRMSPETVRATAHRIAEHARAHDLAAVQVILHGGEPLMPGPGYVGTVAAVLRGTMAARIDLRVQTNGTLLTNPVIDVLAREEIRVGVSLDGGPHANDIHRRYANGRGSHATVARSVRRLRERAPHLFAGVLCTIDLRNDPVETYDAIQEFEPPAVDFLLPHGNWTTPPPGRDPDSAAAPYGQWLTRLFDHWYAISPRRSQIRMFDELIHLMLGGQSQVETVGLAPVGLIVVNTNGDLEQVDALRSAFNGAAQTGLNVHTHDFDAALTHDAIVARQIGAAGLSPTCLQCALHRMCGGGLYAHRYKAGTGFLNPSVYCNDLTYLIQHIYRRVSGDVARLLEKTRIVGKDEVPL